MPRINDRYRIIESDWTPYVTVTLNDTTTDETTVTGTSTGTYWTLNDNDDNRVTVNLHDYWQEVPTYTYTPNYSRTYRWDSDLSFNSNSLWSDSRLSWDPGSFEEAYKRWLKRRNKKRVIRI